MLMQNVGGKGMWKQLSENSNPRITVLLKEEVLLIELCPLSELRRLSTEPPALSFGFSRESVSGRGDCGEPGAASGLD